MHVLDLWCAEQGANAERARSVIGLVAETIKNKGYVVELTILENCLNYISKKIIAYWAKYKRNNSLIVKFQSEWLNTCETI